MLGLVGRGLALPEFWLGDSSGNELWPDEAVAGRQIFRILYSLVAFGTLGGAFGAYASSAVAGAPAVELEPSARAALVSVAACAQGRRRSHAR